MPVCFQSDAEASSEWTWLAPLRARVEALAEGESCFPGSPVGWIRHMSACTLHDLLLNEPCLALVLQGVKKIHASTSARDAITLRPGGFVYFERGQSVSLTNEPEEGRYLALVLSFDQTVLDALARRLPPASPAPPQARQLAVLLGTLLDLLTEHPDATLVSMQQEQILWLLWTYGFPVLKEENTLAHRIRALVEGNPSHPWSGKEFAHRMNMSERNLRRHLAEKGVTTTQLVRAGRLHAGLSLMQQHAVNVEEVAHACGYESRSRFSQRFHEHFGISPADFLHSRLPRLQHS